MHNFFSYILCFLILVSAGLHSDEHLDYISTTSGYIKGHIENKVINYDDIPYAKPPVGSLRWKAPRQLNEPDQILQSKNGNHCIQEPSSMGGAPGKGIITGTEDCLYLDIKTPIRNDSQLLPVMFWIHGGGNTSGLKDIYDFSKMVKRYDVIVVTINYRLGAFGWFTHPAIQSDQNGIDKTSNFGTLDIIQALKWVKSNIDSFGGDPNNITIFGESAGGHNVLSLLVAPQAKGLFHKAISQSGYTTSVSKDHAYLTEEDNPIYKHTSNEVVKRLVPNSDKITLFELKEKLYSLSSKDFFSEYSDSSNLEMPLLTNDDIVIPKVGLENALKYNRHTNNIPLIAGSNRDEVKLWLAAAEYFVRLDYSLFGSITGIPIVKLKNEDGFEAFNFYRSEAWKIRGVIEPLSALNDSGNLQTFAYRYDWDDHRKFVIADFKKLIGASHGTEIPLLTGNNDLVGDYGFLIYPSGPSKRFLSKNMMLLWSNFAKNGRPGKSSNGIEWLPFNQSTDSKNFLVLDNRRNMKLVDSYVTYKQLVELLNSDSRVNKLEKCVILYQMGTYVGNDIFDEIKQFSSFECERKDAQDFLEANSNFIEY
ncbi:carboxylesterase family protein [Gammaproteobacteria bacterium]|nr:carboxylesterase family protein [Gammaproteobacteria bacterium]